jgi:MYXO-CTERM domain-containing protein
MAHYRKTIAVLGLSTASALALALGCSDKGDAGESVSNLDRSSDLVISQVYGGGGNSNAAFQNDFIELFNRGKAAVSLKGKSLQIANEALSFGSDPDSKIDLPDAQLEPGQYFLVKLRGGGAEAGPDLPGQPLPSPSFEAPLANLSQKSGKVALVTASALLEGCGGREAGACEGETILDLVGYGGASQSERAPAPDLSSKKSALRKGAGCIDTNDNAADFATSEPPTPRTTKSEKTDCAKQPDASAPADAAATATTGVLLNELRVKPPGATEGGNEFVEILCPAGAPLTDYYFLAIEGDGDSTGGSPGTVDVVIPLGSKKCGANGLLYVKAENGGTASGDPKTEVLATPELNAKDGGQGPLENATTTFLLVKSPTAIEKGSNVDPDKTGKITGLPTGAAVVDGVATFDQKEGVVDVTYAPRVTIKFGAPWAMSRFKGNHEPLTESAWYGGRLFPKEDPEALKYDRENGSTNLPTDALLTPGAENGKTGPAGPSRTDGGRRDGSAARDGEDEDFGDEIEPTPGQKTKKPPAAPKLGAVNDCSMGSGPVSGSSLAAFGTLAIALAALKRRRRS